LSLNCELLYKDLEDIFEQVPRRCPYRSAQKIVPKYCVWNH